MKVRRYNVLRAFSLLMTEMTRQGVGVAGWKLIDGGFPEGWRIDDATDTVPDLGFLGMSNRQAYDRLVSWRQGMVLVDSMRERGTK